MLRGEGTPQQLGIRPQLAVLRLCSGQVHRPPQNQINGLSG